MGEEDHVSYEILQNEKISLDDKDIEKLNINLFSQIFDQKNNRQTRVDLFRNILIQKLWRVFGESQVFALYLEVIIKKYGRN